MNPHPRTCVYWNGDGLCSCGAGVPVVEPREDLRDRFAMAAANSDPLPRQTDPVALATETAYRIADALLAARKLKEG